jgi:hypothetical protein
MGTRRLLLVSLALLAPVALVGCGGDKGSSAARTVTVTVQATGASTTQAAQTDGEGAATEPAPEPESESEEAVVAVSKMGFSQDEHGEVGYGFVLVNNSAQEDALDVTVTVNVLDASGTIIATEAEAINVIPAGETFYLGGATYASGEKADQLEPIVAVGSSEEASYPLPAVSRVRLINEEYLGLRVRGEVENTLDQPLSQLARIGIVVFDSRGEVVGGGFTFLDADLPPGRRASFDAGNGVGAIPPNRAESAMASVDNEVAPS